MLAIPLDAGGTWWDGATDDRGNSGGKSLGPQNQGLEDVVPFPSG